MAQAVQDFIPIKEIRDDVVILKSGQMRQVLMVSSVNFDLKGEEEKTAILLQFQNFLNSFDFPIQFFIQSRRLDIRPYLETLEGRYREETNDLMRIQIREYIEFVRQTAEQNNIMTKNFFVVIPFAQQKIIGNKGGVLSNLLSFGKQGEPRGGEGKMEAFEEQRSQLEQRKLIVIQGLSQVGIRAETVGTEGLVELFYKLFNPDENKVPNIPV